MRRYLEILNIISREGILIVPYFSPEEFLLRRTTGLSADQLHAYLHLGDAFNWQLYRISFVYIISFT